MPQRTWPFPRTDDTTAVLQVLLESPKDSIHGLEIAARTKVGWAEMLKVLVLFADAAWVTSDSGAFSTITHYFRLTPLGCEEATQFLDGPQG